MNTNKTHPYTHIPSVIEENERARLKLADFPLVIYNKKQNSWYSSLEVFQNLSSGCARILTYEMKLTSLFTLKCHFHSNGKTFTYRSDKYPGDIKVQYKRMLDLAGKNINLSYSMQLYDNRRVTPDDLIMKWNNGVVTFAHHYLPFIDEKPVNDRVIQYGKYLQANFPETKK